MAGVFNIAFQSMSQTIVQLLAPAPIRGRVVGLFNTAMLGLRAGSGLTIGLLGTLVGVVLIVLLNSVLSIMQMPEAGRQVIYGAVIIGMLLVYGRGARVTG